MEAKAGALEDMQRNLAVESKIVEILGFKLFFKIFTPPHTNSTLLCLHGGPGATHDYLLPLSDLASMGFRVVFYDQLGCGRSELPKDKSLFTVERGVEEVEAVRRRLSLGRIHLMGSSYGGLLAIAYALKYQRYLKSVVTTGGLASVPLAIREMGRLKQELPLKIKRVLDHFESRGRYDSKKYVDAVQFFYREHVCRLPNWPEELTYSSKHTSGPVYGTMNGPNEFTIIGNIRYWDATSNLSRIKVPFLVTGGKYDEVTPRVARSIYRGIKGPKKLIIFKKSSHLAMWEEREKYIRAVSTFLDSVDNGKLLK